MATCMQNNNSPVWGGIFDNSYKTATISIKNPYGPYLTSVDVKGISNCSILKYSKPFLQIHNFPEVKITNNIIIT